MIERWDDDRGDEREAGKELDDPPGRRTRRVRYTLWPPARRRRLLVSPGWRSPTLDRRRPPKSRKEANGRTTSKRENPVPPLLSRPRRPADLAVLALGPIMRVSVHSPHLMTLLPAAKHAVSSAPGDVCGNRLIRQWDQCRDGYLGNSSSSVGSRRLVHLQRRRAFVRNAQEMRITSISIHLRRLDEHVRPTTLRSLVEQIVSRIGDLLIVHGVRRTLPSPFDFHEPLTHRKPRVHRHDSGRRGCQLAPAGRPHAAGRCEQTDSREPDHAPVPRHD